MSEVPDITVELHDRSSVLGLATLAGALAGVAMLAVAQLGIGSLAAVGFPHVFDRSTVALQSLFHVLFALMFGSTFGLLVDTRPVWQYGRGFLGPLVGAGFGVLLWVGITGGFWLLGSVGPAAAFGTVPVAVALPSYLVYGTLVGSFMNGFGLLRA